jgi:hypothetical protein
MALNPLLELSVVRIKMTLHTMLVAIHVNHFLLPTMCFWFHTYLPSFLSCKILLQKYSNFMSLMKYSQWMCGEYYFIHEETNLFFSFLHQCVGGKKTQKPNSHLVKIEKNIGYCHYNLRAIRPINKWVHNSIW